jgi:hypothetical protein
MAKTRALMTDTERERIAGVEDVEDIKKYQAISRVRRRIEDELTEDIEILEEHHKGLLDELREVVCEEHASPREPVEETERREQPLDETIEREGREQSPPTHTSVSEVVDRVAESWDDDERKENRKKAAEEVLQHAVDTGQPVGRSSDIVEAVQERYPVEGQNAETYYRKNIRMVLSEVGRYSRGSKKYTVREDDIGENE